MVRGGGGLLLLAAAAYLGLHRPWSREGDASRASASGLPADAYRQLVQVTSERPVGEVTAAAVSPDGRMVAYADRFGVSVHWFDSRPERLLGTRPAFVVDRLSWLPDQGSLLMSGTSTEAHSQQVWAVPLQGAYLQPLLQDANRAVASPEGKRIAFTRNQEAEVWLASSDGQGSRRIFTSDPGTAIGLLLWSPAGDHLVITEVRRSGAAGRPAELLQGTTYVCVDVNSGTVLDREDGVPATSGYMLPGGQLLFAQNNTPGPTTGEASLMTVRTDEKSGQLLGPPVLVRNFSARNAQSLTASLTGTRLAAVLDKAEVDTFVADLHWPGPSLGEPVQLTRAAGQNFPHAWTADGRGVLLESDSIRTAGSGKKGQSSAWP